MNEISNNFLKFNKTAKYLMVLITILIIVKLIELSNNNFNKYSDYTIIGGPMSDAKRCCIGNLKTIEGAIELYNMENKQFYNVSVNDLVDKGYLKTTPFCKTYSNILFWLYFNEINHSYIITNETKEINVECPIHGKLKFSEQPEGSKSKTTQSIYIYKD